MYQRGGGRGGQASRLQAQRAIRATGDGKRTTGNVQRATGYGRGIGWAEGSSRAGGRASQPCRCARRCPPRPISRRHWPRCSPATLLRRAASHTRHLAQRPGTRNGGAAAAVYASTRPPSSARLVCRLLPFPSLPPALRSPSHPALFALLLRATAGLLRA